MPVDWSKYPSTWAALRANVLTLDFNRCRFCYVPNRVVIIRSALNGFRWWWPDDGCEAQAIGVDELRDKCTRIVLTVAHLDHDLRNSTPENLAALCQRCHLRLDRFQHAENAARTRDRKRGQARLPGCG